MSALSSDFPRASGSTAETATGLFLICHLNRIERNGKFSSVSNVCFKIESIEENKRNWIQKSRNRFFEKDSKKESK
jgi:hypothetical protein